MTKPRCSREVRTVRKDLPARTVPVVATGEGDHDCQTANYSNMKIISVVSIVPTPYLALGPAPPHGSRQPGSCQVKLVRERSVQWCGVHCTDTGQHSNMFIGGNFNKWFLLSSQFFLKIRIFIIHYAKDLYRIQS
jgi:hypothetical protein